MKSSRRPDDIEYTEYFVRKAIQPKSLRTDIFVSPRVQKNFYDTRKNFSLFLNKQTAVLRGKYGSNTPIRSLYKKNKNQNDVQIFPNVDPIPSYKIEKRIKHLSEGDERIVKKVMDEINRKKPKDMFVAESEPIIPKKKGNEMNPEKEMEPHERLRATIMSKLDDAEVLPLSDEYMKRLVLERIKEFKQDGITKRLPMQIFYTAPPEQDETNPN